MYCAVEALKFDNGQLTQSRRLRSVYPIERGLDPLQVRENNAPEVSEDH